MISKRSLLISLAAVVVGCGPSLTPVSGRVTLDQKALADVSVMFVPEAGGQPAMGVSDGSGLYSLSTRNTAGVQPGSYIVVVSKSVPMDVNPRTGEATPKGTNPVPAKYANAKTSPLRMTVPSGNYDVVVNTK